MWPLHAYASEDRGRWEVEGSAISKEGTLDVLRSNQSPRILE